MFRIASSLTQLSGRPNGAGLNEIVGMPYINDREQDSNQSCTAQNHHIMMCPCHDHRYILLRSGSESKFPITAEHGRRMA